MAKNSTFTRLIDEEKLQKHLEELRARREELRGELAAIEREMEAATAYVQISSGRGYQPSLQVEPKPRAPSTRVPRGARAELRTQILDLLKDSDGMTAEAINSELDATDKKHRQQIANLLSLMKKDGVLAQEARRGPYTIAREQHEAP